MTCEIPPGDMPTFCTLPTEARAEVTAWLKAMKHLLSVTGNGIGIAIQKQARNLNKSIQTVRLKYDKYRKSGDWKVFVNLAKFPSQKDDAVLDPRFVEFWRALCEGNQRKCRPAWRKLIRLWRDWQRGGTPIPGYESCPPETIHGHPEGWSYRNLMRHIPTKFELKAIRHGLSLAIAEHGPKVLSTRVGLWPGSHIQVDDLTRDFKVHLTGKNTLARIQEIGWLDVSSGSRFLVHRRPQWEENGKKNSLKEVEMRFTVACFVRNVGYSPLGTEILSEHGTAAIRNELQAFLLEHSGGLLTVRESGMTGKEQAIVGYKGRGGGNPRHKPNLESLHNLLHNEAGDLPMQTGHGRNYPEWLFGLNAITEGVCKSLLALPREKAELLISPALTYWQALDILNIIDQRIDRRTDHDLEGWAKLGREIIEYRHDLNSDVWMSNREFLALPPAQQTVLQYAAQSSPLFRRKRKLAPVEVFAPAMSDFIRFPDHVVALMFCDNRLGMDLRVKKSLDASDGRFHMSHGLADPEEMFFSSEIENALGGMLRLEERAEYGVVLNPFDPERLWVYGPRGEYLGTAARVHRFCQLNAGDVQKVLGHRSHELASLLTPLKDRHAGASEEIKLLQEHNDRVKEGRATDAASIAAEKRLLRNPVFSPEEIADVLSTDRVQVELSEEEIAELCNL